VEDTTLRTDKFLARVCVVLAIFLFVGFGYAQNTTQPQDPGALIEKGMQAFGNHKYEQASVLFRQARRVDNQVKKLSQDERSKLDKLLDDSARGATHYRVAEGARSQGKRAMESADFAGARKYYSRVIDAESFVPKSWVQDAKVQLGVITEKEKVTVKVEASVVEAKPTTKPAVFAGKPISSSKKSLTKKAWPTKKESDATVRLTVSEGQVNAPVTKSTKVRRSANQRRTVVTERPTPVVMAGGQSRQPSQPTLLDEILAGQQVQKEQAIASYRGTERRIRQAVVDHQYLAARDMLRQAHDDILRSRRLFNQDEMERVLLENDSLAKFIDSEEQAFQQQQVLLQMKEAQQKKLDREQQIQSEKFKKIMQLFGEAIKLRRDHKYKEALDMVHQVLIIDPNNDRAKWFIEDVQDMDQFARQQEIKELNHREGQRSLVDAEEALIPWADETTYPKNWREMMEKREKLLKKTGRLGTGESLTSITRKELKTIIFPDTAAFKGNLRNAFNQFKLKGIKVLVSWDVLETEGVTPDDEVKMQDLDDLKNVTAKDALEIILKAMGTVEFNYAIDSDGKVSISTTDSLRTKGSKPEIGLLATQVYDVYDLMFSSQRNITVAQLQAPSTGSGGGGSTGSALGSSQEQTRTQNTEAENVGGNAKSIVDLIVTLVRPDTWSPEVPGSIGQGSGTVDLWNRHWLIICQSPEVHSEIEQFLAKMRESQTVQISLEARFVTVSSNFLEKIGVNLDMVLNQGNAGYDYTGAENTFGDPRFVGSGVPILQPRAFSYLSGLPTPAPGGTGVIPSGYAQPWGSQALVPGGNRAGFSPFPFMSGSNSLVAPESTNVPGSLADRATRPAFQVMGAFLDDLQVNFLLEATQIDRYSNIVQAPRVIMQNGTEGLIRIESIQPYIGGVSQQIGSGAAGANIQASFMSFGTLLRVQANTTDLRYVNLLVEPTITSPDAALDLNVQVPTVTSGGGSTTATGTGTASSTGGVGFTNMHVPGLRSQAIITQVSVPDGGTVLIGGLKQSGTVESEAGPPVLNKIPLIKRLFTNKAVTKDTFTLLILVKPKIILREETEQAGAGETTRSSGEGTED